MKKFNIVFSIILIVLATLHLCCACIMAYADFSRFEGLIEGFFLISHIYVVLGLFLVYIILLLCSIFIKQLKGIFKFRYLGINVLAVCIVVLATCIWLYRLGELLNQF